MNRIYGYLRASTADQDATRAKVRLENFITNLGHKAARLRLSAENHAKDK
jgi:DNA invertase Pin-like site-specific DNA recombinase